ncbi:MAG: hypothetical protein AAGA24_04445 [Pseudomonadota bacterium]
MDKTVLFWTIAGLLGFAFALAVQMRIMVALVLRRAVMAKYADMDRSAANAAIMAAAAPGGRDRAQSEAVGHLVSTYPMPLSHLRRARRASLVTPVILIAVLALGRLQWGML